MASSPDQSSEAVSAHKPLLAVLNGEKIYISKKTILTPSARDLGEEKEVFASV